MALSALIKAVPAAAASVAPALLSAGEGTSSGIDISSIMQSAANTATSQANSVLAIVVPAIVGITVAVVGIKFGIGWIRKIKGN